MESLTNLRSLWLIARRRFWYFTIPATITLTAVTVFILLLEPIYRSYATILVEEQEIPDELVSSLVGDFIDRRLDTLNRRILISDNLLRLIDRHDLYAEERDEATPTALANTMRGNVGMRILSTAVNNTETGRTGVATVAFELSFKDPDPEKAQRVTNELVSLFLETNLQERRASAEGTASFFERERLQIEQRIDQLEGELAEFQMENVDALPAQAAMRREIVTRLESDLRNFERQLQSLAQREAFLAAELSFTSPVDDRVGATSPQSQVELLRAELALATARYSPDHPDVRRLSRELRSMQAAASSSRAAGGGGGSSELRSEQQRLATELAGLRERYTAEHPDVLRTQRQLNAVEAQLSASTATGGAQTNPAYARYNSELNAVRSEINAIKRQQEMVRAEIATNQQALLRSPMVEAEYTALQNAVADARVQRAEMLAKESVARLGQSLETEAIGERLSLIEPPTVPLWPDFPNKKLFMLLGIVLAMGVGGGTAAAAELFDQSVRSERDVLNAVGERPLVVVPHFTPLRSPVRKFATRGLILLAIAAAVAAVMAVVHTHYLPLDVLIFDLHNQATGLLD